MHEPPVQSDYHARSGNYQLESNPERHDKSPVAVAIGNGFRGVSLEVMRLLRLNWKDRFGYCAPHKPVTLVQRVGRSENLRENALQGGFFVSGKETTTTSKWSQVDLLLIVLFQLSKNRNLQYKRGLMLNRTKTHVRREKPSKKSTNGRWCPFCANLRLKRHRFEGVFQCPLYFDLSDKKLLTCETVRLSVKPL